MNLMKSVLLSTTAAKKKGEETTNIAFTQGNLLLLFQMILRELAWQSIWITALTGIAKASVSCPLQCMCHDDAYLGLTITCTVLYSVPKNFPKETKYLTLNFSGCHALDIDPNTVSILSEVKSLRISGKIGTIKTRAFVNLAGVNAQSTILFVEAKIDTVETLAFDHVQSLQVQFIRSKIGSISPHAFSALKNVWVLWSESYINEILPKAFSGISDNQKATLTFELCNLGIIHPFAFSHIHNISSIYLKNVNVEQIKSQAFADVHSLAQDFIIQNSWIQTLESAAFAGISKVHLFAVVHTSVQCMGQDVFANISYIERYSDPLDVTMGNHFPPIPMSPAVSNSLTCFDNKRMIDLDCAEACHDCTTPHLICSHLPFSFPNQTKYVELNLVGADVTYNTSSRLFCNLLYLQSVYISGRAETVNWSELFCPINEPHSHKVNVSVHKARVGEWTIGKNPGIKTLTLQNSYIKSIQFDMPLDSIPISVAVDFNWITNMQGIVASTTLIQSFMGNRVQCCSLTLLHSPLQDYSSENEMPSADSNLTSVNATICRVNSSSVLPGCTVGGEPSFRFAYMAP